MATYAQAPSHSIMDDISDSGDDESFQGDIVMDQQAFYQHQHQQQQMQYEQHQAENPNANVTEEELEDEDAFSDESSVASVPDEHIDFSLTYALHTFLATVEGQASVVKGDSLVLLDDANSYWWLVRVLKTEDVGYIPAENIETPFERLARLNKHRNVGHAAATDQEKAAAAVQGREKLKGLIAGKAKDLTSDKSGEKGGFASRRVDFAPPTYVDHPGVTWSSDEEESEGEDEMEEAERDVESDSEGPEREHGEAEISGVEDHLVAGAEMEPDDGIAWEAGAGEQEQKRIMERNRIVTPQSNNPFAPRPTETIATGFPNASSSSTSLASTASIVLDPAQAGETRRLTATPSVAQGALLPSVMAQQPVARNVSGQSIQSVSSVVSSASASTARSSTPTSPEKEDGRKMKKAKKDEPEKKKSKGVLGGLFSRSKKDKKGISSVDPRSSEESMVSGAVEPISQRFSEESSSSPASRARAASSPQQTVSHSLKLQQRDQELQQSYQNKYLVRSPTTDQPHTSANEAAAAVAQSAAAMRLAATMNTAGSSTSQRPSSIILSPNPAGPPLLNVIRLFSGEHIKSEASFKTVLLNETTSSADLIRQAIQRFGLHGNEAIYYLTVKDVSGDEMELAPEEKPLSAFEQAVQRWAEEQEERRADAMTPTVKRSSVGSISSIKSNLSTHPAIQKLGMNDFSDDSTVKIYLNRRRPNSHQGANGNGMPDPASEFSSYSTQLSTVQESSPEQRGSEWSSPGDTPPGRAVSGSDTATPSTPHRLNPSLTINVNGQASPERFSSPSARFTVQLVIHPTDLPDSLSFDPASDAIISRSQARERHIDERIPNDVRRKVFVLPRNATVVETIEQGLERFGIQEGVVDGGDDVEDKTGKKVKYALVAAVSGQGGFALFPSILRSNADGTVLTEKPLSLSSKLLEAYPSPPVMKLMERMTPEQRRRSRDASQNAGNPSDLLGTDPVFILRRVGRKPVPLEEITLGRVITASEAPLSPQEIIAAQRAASRAHQKSLISAHNNTSQGVDLVLPDKGTLRSSRLLEPDGEETVRYSFIDGENGETYDISELLEEEWGHDSPKPQLAAPQFKRTGTGNSSYHTAPSTPEPASEDIPPPLDAAGGGGKDILKGVLQKNDGRNLEEKIQRVINKVRSGSLVKAAVDESAPTAPTISGRQTPQNGSAPRTLSPLPEGRPMDPSGPAALVHTAASVNRIVSRHRQQPSIASIMSDLSATAPEHPDRDGSITPMTATTSSHPTPQFSGAVFTRAVGSRSPTPVNPVRYKDDFGMKEMLASIEARARELRPTGKKKVDEADEVERRWWGERVDLEGVQPEIRGCFEGIRGKLESFERDLDDLLVGLLTTTTTATTTNNHTPPPAATTITT
ncbi:hypothetical protein P7C73_g4761, partial [Tremellales sp. Uapishka_1]